MSYHILSLNPQPDPPTCLLYFHSDFHLAEQQYPCLLYTSIFFIFTNVFFISFSLPKSLIMKLSSTDHCPTSCFSIYISYYTEICKANHPHQKCFPAHFGFYCSQAAIPRHTGQKAITEDDLEGILTSLL